MVILKPHKEDRGRATLWLCPRPLYSYCCVQVYAVGHEGWKGVRYTGQRNLMGKIEIVKNSPSPSPSPSPPPPSKTVIKKFVEESPSLSPPPPSKVIIKKSSPSPSPSPPPPSKVGRKATMIQSRPCQLGLTISM